MTHNEKLQLKIAMILFLFTIISAVLFFGSDFSRYLIRLSMAQDMYGGMISLINPQERITTPFQIFYYGFIWAHTVTCILVGLVAYLQFKKPEYVEEAGTAQAVETLNG